MANPEEGSVFLYRNGEVVDERPYDGTFTDSPNSEALGIGVKTTNAGDAPDPGGCCPGYWDGMLDDLGIWHRALSEAEIKEIHTNGLAGMPLLGGGGVVGDFDKSGDLDAPDIELLSVEVRSGENDPAFDLTDDLLVDQNDRIQWVEGLKNTYFGDANLDGEFNSSDLVLVFQLGQYEDGIPENSTWGEGDWNGDADFDSSDFVIAFQGGGFERGPRAATQVPEPCGFFTCLLALIPCILRAKSRSLLWKASNR